MPIKPKPFTCVCDACGWSRTVAPRSDVLMPGEWPERCAKWGSKALTIRQAGWLKGAKAELLARWRF